MYCARSRMPSTSHTRLFAFGVYVLFSVRSTGGVRVSSGEELLDVVGESSGGVASISRLLTVSSIRRLVLFGLSAQSLCLESSLFLFPRAFISFLRKKREEIRSTPYSFRDTNFALGHQLTNKMARFSTVLCFVFALGLFSSASMAAPTPSPAPKLSPAKSPSAAPKISPAKSPASPSPAASPTVASPPPAASPTIASPPAAAPVTTPPAGGPSEAASPTFTSSSPVSPPSPAKSGASSTASLGNMAIFGAALVGGAAFLL